MPPQLVLIKWILAIFCVFFAYNLGRCVTRRFVQKDHTAPLNRWAFRTVVAALGVLWSDGFGASGWLALASAGVAGVLGFYQERRPKRPEEDLSKVIFPKE
jgi:NhaP-type Na+/H+ or K+/H+ antiporter